MQSSPASVSIAVNVVHCNWGIWSCVINRIRVKTEFEKKKTHAHWRMYSVAKVFFFDKLICQLFQQYLFKFRYYDICSVLLLYLLTIPSTHHSPLLPVLPHPPPPPTLLSLSLLTIPFTHHSPLLLVPPSPPHLTPVLSLC